MTREFWTPLVEEASLAPSVHNVQPARWRIDGDALTLFEFARNRLNAADPSGQDAQMSLGAAYEGLCIAASRHGVALSLSAVEGVREDELLPVARIERAGDCEADRLADFVPARQSWRGNFLVPGQEQSKKALSLAGEDCHVFTEAVDLGLISTLLDDASLSFMKDEKFRRELFAWMRLSKGHPRWHLDGLNADALQMSHLEAAGASVLLGKVFPFLDRFGFTRAALSEKGKTTNATAIAIYHRPLTETPFDAGRHFYRLWLRIEKAGFGAAVLAAIADHEPTSEILHKRAGLGADRKIVSAFRIGVRGKGKPFDRARLPVDDLFV